MKVEFVNPFIKSTLDVLKQVASLEPTKDKVFLMNDGFEANGIAALVGLTGKVNGQVVLSMDTEFAKHVVSQMLGGQPVRFVNKVVESGIGELSSIILGNASSILSTQGYPCKASPPVLAVGDKVRFSTIELPMIVVDFSSPHGQLHIYLAIK
ncbi:MAG: hypothetical protein CVV64_10425 [Candidatus Wallbacteria bacterium HGW-Wallbacteria-1]|jgi:chemotaxis protein CheX|uniref:Chemotaxis phosphatase CheX-like domain-containing protein n=1 Tax=Candidatus Wallbacteria bacterium HGW-Wallbacteria-1 TaxID=2013854 RepID=A0A2N1PP63_9BACT|nr:MAG: hypothetical protein CVV64_10425 [Candidatus Wallbacteria bacterium HGW-Wallbacteria-1]